MLDGQHRMTHESKMFCHLVYERHLNPLRYNGIMLFDDIVVFPLWNLSGVYCGYQQYRPDADKQQKNDPREGRYYTSLHGNKNEKPLGIWGLETFDYRRDFLIITEGIFDAAQFHNLGFPAVALLSSSHKNYRNWLTSISRKVYKVEDDHGSKLGPYQAMELPEGRTDAGECSSIEIYKMVRNALQFS